MTELISTTKQLKGESDALNNLQQVTEVNVEQLEENIVRLEGNYESQLERVKKQLDEKEDVIKVIGMKIDELEQTNRSTNLRIVGLPEEEDEDVTSKVIDLTRDQLRIEHIRQSDFESIQRMGPKHYKQSRDVMVRCSNIAIKNQMYKRRKSMQSSNNPIYINEDLTSHRGKLFYHARKLKKSGKLFGVWSQEGNIMIKVKEDTQPTTVRDYDALKKLFHNANESTGEQETDGGTKHHDANQGFSS